MNVPRLLKLNWERRSPSLILSTEEIEKALTRHTSQRVISYNLLSNGCANSNFKVTLSNGDNVILRLYTRDSEALRREFNIHKLIQDKIPVPRFLHINEDKTIIPYPYAVMEYIEGHLFRDVILEGNETAIKDCAYQAGQILTHISSFDFKTPGFFESDLKIKPFEENQTFYDLISSFLAETQIIDCMGKDLIERLAFIVKQNKEALIELSEHHNLTHADYDPSNMLVKFENGRWKITAILDWEFALSSTYFMDMGLMLRYAPQLPSFYQESFVQGIKDMNPSFLPQDWEIRAKLVDILSLLSLCSSENKEHRPLMVQDVKTILGRY